MLKEPQLNTRYAACLIGLKLAEQVHPIDGNQYVSLDLIRATI